MLDSLTEEALSDYPKMFASQRALFVRGLMALENQEWEDAYTSFETLADQWPDSYLAPVGLYNAGSAREEAGDTDGAQAAWTRLAENYTSLSPDVPAALFSLGRLSESQNSQDEALGYYSDLEARFPDSRWTDWAKDRILVIESL